MQPVASWVLHLAMPEPLLLQQSPLRCVSWLPSSYSSKLLAVENSEHEKQRVHLNSIPQWVAVPFLRTDEANLRVEAEPDVSVWKFNELYETE
jgi:hypothetical protein